MFYIDNSGGIHITRGDSVTLATDIYIGIGENELLELSESDCVIFTVRSKNSGELKIKRILTADNYENGELVLCIAAEETMMTPAKYEYSFLYLPDKTMPHEQAFTYAQGDFEVMHAVTTYKDSEG